MVRHGVSRTTVPECVGNLLTHHDALQSMSWDDSFQQSLSAASQPEHCLEELPADLRQDEDEMLVVDDSDDDSNFGSSVVAAARALSHVMVKTVAVQ